MKDSLGSRFLPHLWAVHSSHSQFVKKQVWGTIGTSVSTCIKVNLSAVKIRNEKVSIWYLFQFLLRYKVHEDTGSVLPWPTRILSSYRNFLDRVNWANQQHVWVIWSHTWDQPSLLKLGQTMCLFVFHTGLLSLFLRQYCLDPLILKSCLYMFHTVRPNAYSFSKLGTLLFVSGFSSRSHSKVPLSTVQFEIVWGPYWENSSVFS